MTYSPIQLEIIRVFGRKELTEGLVIIHENQIGKIIGNKGYNFLITYEKQWKEFESKIGEISEFFIKKDCEILGHIPHLEDVLRTAKDKFADMDIHMTHLVFFDRNPMDMNTSEGVHMIEYNQYVPLIDQPESVLIELLNLFK